MELELNNKLSRIFQLLQLSTTKLSNIPWSIKAEELLFAENGLFVINGVANVKYLYPFLGNDLY